MARRALREILIATVGIATIATLPRAWGHDDPAEHAGASASANPHASDAEMAQAAQNFWMSLTPELQQKAGFSFEDKERYNWHFIPRERKGITWNDMNSAQQALAHAFLASGLSQRGYMQAETIMSLDQVLK